MNTVKKTIFLMILLAIVIPVAYSSKLISWISPRDLNPANIFQTAGISVANFVISLNKNGETIIPDSDIKEIPDNQVIFKAPLKPYRILIMGDSLVAVSGGFGDILEQKLINMDDLEVLRKGKVSSGMSRPDYFDWQKESASLIDSFRPNIAIAMMGTNDAQSFEIIKGGVKKVLVYGTPEWDAEYTNRLKVFNKQLTSNNVKVYWIGLPAMRDEGYAKKIRHVNELNESASKENDQVTYLSAEKLMAGEGELYQAFMPDDKGVMHATRIADGIHLTRFGGMILVNKVIEELNKDLGLED